jgi:heat shock protein HtpX
VLLQEVRRRNRRRLVLLALLAMVNLWVVVTALLVGVLMLTATPVAVSFRWIAPLVAVAVVVHVLVQVLIAGRSTLEDLGAVEVQHDTWPRTSNLIEEIAVATSTSAVRLAYVEEPVPNAITVGVGRRSTVIIVTTGLVERLSRDELEAVVAVQMCAVARLDVALRTVVVACASGALGLPGFIRTYLADVWYPTLVRLLTTPSRLAAAWSRRRTFRECDFGADDMAVAITRYPAALRSALVVMLEDPRVVAAVTPANAPLWFEPMPYADGDREVEVPRHSMTPSLEDRIARLPMG